MNIPQHIIDELIEQAERDAPIESCGYLMGTGDNVSENYPMEKPTGTRTRHRRRDPRRKTCGWPKTPQYAMPYSRCSAESQDSTRSG